MTGFLPARPAQFMPDKQTVPSGRRLARVEADTKQALADAAEATERVNVLEVELESKR